MINVTMTPGGKSLQGAMRRNLELLVELEKTAPGDVAMIVESLIAHLRSWKPMAAAVIPVSLDTGPIARIDTVAEIVRVLADGSTYRLSTEGGALVLAIGDAHEGQSTSAMEPVEVVRLRADLDSVASSIGAAR